MSANYGGRWKTRNYNEGRCICGKRSKGISYPGSIGTYCSHECARKYTEANTVKKEAPNGHGN